MNTSASSRFLFTRQLEAIIRIAESQAKMRLAAFASDADVDEALRLFQVSTLDAATSGNLAGMGVWDIHLVVLGERWVGHSFSCPW